MLFVTKINSLSYIYDNSVVQLNDNCNNYRVDFRNHLIKINL